MRPFGRILHPWVTQGFSRASDETRTGTAPSSFVRDRVEGAAAVCALIPLPQLKQGRKGILSMSNTEAQKRLERLYTLLITNARAVLKIGMTREELNIAIDVAYDQGICESENYVGLMKNRDWQKLSTWIDRYVRDN